MKILKVSTNLQPKDPVPAQRHFNLSQRWTTSLGMLALSGSIWTLVACGQPSSGQAMDVEVRIQNMCDLIDSAFQAYAEPDGAKASFESGVAVLHTLKTSKIYIKGHENFPAFKFETPKVKAAPQLTIKVQCSPIEKIDKTLEAMRKQFKH